MDILPPDGSQSAPVEALTIKTFTLASCQDIKLDLGTYRLNGKKPEFRMYVHDAARLESPGSIVYSDLTLHHDDGLTYTLKRIVLSYSQKTHTITASYANAAAKQLNLKGKP